MVTLADIVMTETIISHSNKCYSLGKYWSLYVWNVIQIPRCKLRRWKLRYELQLSKFYYWTVIFSGANKPQACSWIRPWDSLLVCNYFFCRYLTFAAYRSIYSRPSEKSIRHFYKTACCYEGQALLHSERQYCPLCSVRSNSKKHPP
jgi:hypothetical protein